MGGPFTDWAGRKTVIIVADLFLVLAALIMSLANSVSVLVVGRIVTGVGFGLAVIVTPIYQSSQRQIYCHSHHLYFPGQHPLLLIRLLVWLPMEAALCLGCDSCCHPGSRNDNDA